MKSSIPQVVDNQRDSADLESLSAPINAERIDSRLEISELKRKSIRGGTITAASQAISTALHLASTIILARLLTPADFGIIAMVTAITSFAGLFRDLGLSSAAIQKKHLTAGQQTNLFWLNVVMGAILTVLVSACSPLVSWFYDKPELTAVTITLSFNFLIGSLGAQHGAMLVRTMQFGRRAVAGIAGGVLSLVVAIALAYAGYSYWSLVVSGLLGTAITSALLFILSPFWPGLPGRGRGVREMLAFGANVTAFNLVNYFHRNLDSILIGRFWGAHQLGLYSRAYELLMFPITAIRGPINAVAFPAMSRLQNQPKVYRAYYRRVTGLLAYASMPITAFLFVSSNVLIEVTLGPQWVRVSPIFAILALTALIQPVAGLRGMVMLSSGQGARYFQWGLLNSICVSIGFVYGIQWGPMGIAIAYAVVNYILLYPSLLIAFYNTPLKLFDFFTPIVVPLTLSIFAATFSYALTLLGLIPFDSAIITLLTQALSFIAAFATIAVIVPKARIELRDLASTIGIVR